MPSWIGPWEIAIVVIIALLIFGPSKLPGLGSSLGKSISGFKRGLQESQDEFRSALKDDAEATVSAEAPSTPAAGQAMLAKEPVMTTSTVEPPSA
jgi:sec-independent protein translocase protein TatA